MIKGKLLLMLLVLLVSTGTSPANAVFGLSKCEKTEGQIIKLESKVKSQIRSVLRVGNLVQKSSPLIIKVYSDADSLEESLSKIRYLGLNNLKCYNARQSARLRVDDFWRAEYYVELYPLNEYLALSKKNDYLSVYSSILK